MRKTPSLPGKASATAFTLIELLVTIGIVAVLASLLMPVIAGVQENGKSTKCTHQLRQIGAAMALYANDYNNTYPPLVSAAKVDWDSDTINPYLPERPDKRQSILFICPSAIYAGDRTSDLSRTYSATEAMVPPSNSWSEGALRSNFTSMVGTLVLFDALQAGTNRYANEEVTWTQVSGGNDLKVGSKTSAYIDYRHHDAFHGLFADGHVDTIKRAAANTTVTKTMWKGNNR